MHYLSSWSGTWLLNGLSCLFLYRREDCQVPAKTGYYICYLEIHGTCTITITFAINYFINNVHSYLFDMGRCLFIIQTFINV